MIAHIPWVCFLVGWQIAQFLKAALHCTATWGSGSVAVTGSCPIVVVLLLPCRRRKERARHISCGLCPPYVHAWVRCPLCCGCCGFSLPQTGWLLLETPLRENCRGPLNGDWEVCLPNMNWSCPSQRGIHKLACFAFLTLLPDNQRKHDVTALCPPAGDTSVKPSFLEAPPQKEDLKEHVCSPPAAFISDSQNCKIPSEVIHFSFQLVFACLFLCRWGEVRGPGSTHWAPPFLYLLLPKCVERVHKLFTHPASANTVIVTWKMRY